MKNVFASSWLPCPAEHILRRVLFWTGTKWVLGDERVRGAWGVLCADLVGAADVGGAFLLDVLEGGGGGDETPTERRKRSEEVGVDDEVKRELWGVLANTWKGRQGDVSWEDAVRFLGIPFG
jgi:hypothetical protein